MQVFCIHLGKFSFRIDYRIYDYFEFQVVEFFIADRKDYKILLLGFCNLIVSFIYDKLDSK